MQTTFNRLALVGFASSFAALVACSGGGAGKNSQPLCGDSCGEETMQEDAGVPPPGTDTDAGSSCYRPGTIDAGSSCDTKDAGSSCDTTDASSTADAACPPRVQGCTRTLGYWKNHTAWPVTTLELGGTLYTQVEL